MIPDWFDFKIGLFSFWRVQFAEDRSKASNLKESVIASFDN